VLLLVVAALCYIVGYRTGTQRIDQQKDADFRLIVDKAMYEAAQRGDLQKVQSSYSILLLSDVRDYERRFGAPSGTNRLARDFAAAQVMAKQIESRLVPISSIAAKLGSNVTFQAEPER
jgi:hypothetical protein